MVRILRVHNQYRVRGGEEVVFDEEVNLLRSYGHDVSTCEVSNDDIDEASPMGRLNLVVSTVWSREGRRMVRQAVKQHRPDIVHFDNTFPRISPAAYSVARGDGAAVVQTLHNYRLLCPNGMFIRNGGPCEDCLGKFVPLPGVVHACYRNSRPQSAAVASMLTAHRLRRTWAREVDRYIALTAFGRNKFVHGGLPAERIVVKPHFVSNDELGEGRGHREHFLFIGRLSQEKGLHSLLEAWKLWPDLPSIDVLGDGPMLEKACEVASSVAKLSIWGKQTRKSVLAKLGQSYALVYPSVCYESFGNSIIEAFSSGTPVIASRHGAMAEIVADGRTGLLFEPGDAQDLAEKVRWAANHPDDMRRMGRNARQEYEARYTPERNYEKLMDIYEQAIYHAKHREYIS